MKIKIKDKSTTNITVRIPNDISKDLKEIAEKNYRSFNGELIIAIKSYTTEYNKDWRNKH
jgi:hypothetical protein